MLVTRFSRWDDAGVAADTDAVDAIVAQWREVRPELDTVPMAVIGRIYRIADAVGSRMEAAYQRFGISRGEFDVLATLRRSGEPYTLSPSTLSSTLMITSGGITGRLDKLERGGLLVRAPDPADRRGIRVTLTDEGVELVDRAVEAGLEIQREALEGSLTGPQVKQLEQLLRHLMVVAER
jgi:DNA-binding MarR family transcriptional regulator